MIILYCTNPVRSSWLLTCGRSWLAFCLILFVGLLVPSRGGSSQTGQPEAVTFRSGDLELGGFVWKPAGGGPFPAVLWNHGSEKKPGTVKSVAPYFVDKGYVFFVPHRRGQGRSQGAYIRDELARAHTRGEGDMMLVDLHEIQLQDQLAGLAYLKGLPYVNSNRIAVMGFSFGGIQTMLAAEKGAGYRVAVDCSGAAQTWWGSPELRKRLTEAADKASIPVFFLQAENDYDLRPNQVLSEHMRKKGKIAEAKVYPAFGTGPRQGHSFCIRGTEIWGPDVLEFIERHLK